MEDALFAIEQGVDWIALSFVRTAEDLKELSNLIQEKSPYKKEEATDSVLTLYSSLQTMIITKLLLK